jgi:hypothetical protein
VTPAQFRSLRWIEGSWRGTGAGPNAFYERYRFVNDTTIASHSLPDSTLSQAGDSSLIILNGGEIRNRGGSSEWVATALGGDSIYFAPWRGARNTFVFHHESRDAWRAVLRWRRDEGVAQERVYSMRRMGP